MAKAFGEARRVEIGPCKNRGEFGKEPLTPQKRDGYCDGKAPPLSLCPGRYALFGLLSAKGGWMEEMREDVSCSLEGGSCPEYVKWAIPWEDENGEKKIEYLIDRTGLGPGYKAGCKGPCIVGDYESTNPEILDNLGKLLDMIKGDNPTDNIAKYLQRNLGAPEDITERTKELIHDEDFHTPRTKVDARKVADGLLS